MPAHPASAQVATIPNAIRTDAFTSFLAMVSLHHLDEPVEKVGHLVRAGARLRMALETVGGPVGELNALQRTVKQGPMRRPDVSGEGGFIHGEAVVLAGDEDTAGRELLHRMVRAVMA